MGYEREGEHTYVSVCAYMCALRHACPCAFGC